MELEFVRVNYTYSCKIWDKFDFGTLYLKKCGFGPGSLIREQFGSFDNGVGSILIKYGLI